MRKLNNLALLGSCALHGALAAMLSALPSPGLPFSGRLLPSIEMAVYRRTLPARQTEPPAFQRLIAPPSALRPVRLPLRLVGPQAVAPGRQSAAAPAEQSPPPPAPAAAGKTPGPIDLFPQSTLKRVAESGTLQTRSGAGGNPEKKESAAESTSAGLQRTLVDLAAQAEVRTGRVDPVWREAEREMERRFAPPFEAVTSAPRVALVVRQLFHGARPAPEMSPGGWASRIQIGDRIRQEVTAAHDAYDEPAVSRVAEIDAEVDADGKLVAVRMVLGSGSSRLDREALQAVERALRLRPFRDPRGRVVARFTLRAEAAINIPRFSQNFEAGTGGVSGLSFNIAGTFDEVTGKVSVRLPGGKRLRTRVSLLSVVPVAAPPGAPDPNQP